MPLQSHLFVDVVGCATDQWIFRLALRRLIAVVHRITHLGIFPLHCLEESSQRLLLEIAARHGANTMAANAIRRNEISPREQFIEDSKTVQ